VNCRIGFGRARARKGLSARAAGTLATGPFPGKGACGRQAPG
jgi:hypothetical protein